MSMKTRYSVCFVCTGNACRSPFAECVLRRLLDNACMKDIEVFSVGTSDWGENPRDAAMTDVANEMGYNLTGTTTAMTYERLMAADLIIAFEERHRNDITRVLDYGHWNRIVLFNSIAFGMDGNVEDPYYQSAAVYRRTARHIEEGCQRLIEKWQASPPKPGS